MQKKIQNRKYLIILSFIGIILLLSSAAQALPDQQKEQAGNFIQSLGNEAIGYIGDPNLSNEQEKNNLKYILDKNFDLHTISRFVLGKYWKDLTTAQQKEYRILFEEMIVSIYASKLSRYQGQDFNVRSAHPASGSDFIVMSYIMPKAGENISVNWRVRIKNNEFKIVDVAIKDVSMIITQRADFSSIIQRHGGNTAIILDYLRDRAEGGS